MGTGCDNSNLPNMPKPLKCKRCNGSGKIIGAGNIETECPECLGEGTALSWNLPSDE